MQNIVNYQKKYMYIINDKPSIVDMLLIVIFIDL